MTTPTREEVSSSPMPRLIEGAVYWKRHSVGPGADTVEVGVESHMRSSNRSQLDKVPMLPRL